jgi:hypothetical protein
MSGTDVLAEEAEAIPPSEEAELSQGDEEVLEDQEGSQRSLLGQSVPDASNFNKTKKHSPLMPHDALMSLAASLTVESEPANNVSPCSKQPAPCVISQDRWSQERAHLRAETLGTTQVADWDRIYWARMAKYSPTLHICKDMDRAVWTRQRLSVLSHGIRCVHVTD